MVSPEAPMQDYRGLAVWRKAHALAIDVWRCTRSFPRRETASLISQIRRSAQSIPANICEGTGRRSQREFVRYLYISAASASELDYHLLFSRDLGLLSSQKYEEFNARIQEIRRMEFGLIEKIERTEKERRVSEPDDQ
jgi:four helix bundle protein